MNSLTFPSTVPEHLKTAYVPTYLWTARKGFKGLKAFTSWALTTRGRDVHAPTRSFHILLEAAEVLQWNP